MIKKLVRWYIYRSIQNREWPELLTIFWEEMRKEFREENNVSTLATIIETLEEQYETKY